MERLVYLHRKARAKLYPVVKQWLSVFVRKGGMEPEAQLPRSASRVVGRWRRPKKRDGGIGEELILEIPF